MESRVILKNINLEIKYMFGNVASLKYAFSFSPQLKSGTDIEFYFPMPKNSVISGFKIRYGNAVSESRIVGLDEADKDVGASLIEAYGNVYTVKMYGMPALDFVLEVEATVFMNIETYGIYIDIPLYTDRAFSGIGGVDEAYRNADVKITGDFRAADGFTRIHSPIGSDFFTDGHFTLKTHTGSDVRIYADSPGFDLTNKGFVMQHTDRDLGMKIDFYTGVYYIRPTERFKPECIDYLYVIEMTDDASILSDASSLLCALVSETPINSRFEVKTDDGRAFTAFIQKDGMYGESRDALDIWLSSLLDTGTASERALPLPERRYTQTIYISTCGAAAVNADMREAAEAAETPFNIISVCDSIFDETLCGIAEKSGGQFSHYYDTVDLSRFASGFLSVVGAGELKNMTIMDYALGTYYVTPERLARYKSGSLITVVFRSKGKCPNCFLIEADGGFSKDVYMESITEVDGDTAEKAFACLTIREAYRYLGEYRYDARSVRRLKETIARISKSAGAISPENGCVIVEKGKGGDERRRSIRLTLDYVPDEYEKSSVFRDSAVYSYADADKCCRKAAGALLSCVRYDGSITTPFESSARGIAVQTAYAAAALSAALEKELIDDGYDCILSGAAAYLEGCGIEYGNVPIIFDTSEAHALDTVVRSLDVIEISRLLLNTADKC